jgi:hypothetical protein
VTLWKKERRNQEEERMSHFAVHIATTNAAFEDDAAPFEIARILRELADRVESDPDDLIRLRDINGNRVGYATFHEPDNDQEEK